MSASRTRAKVASLTFRKVSETSCLQRRNALRLSLRVTPS